MGNPQMNPQGQQGPNGQQINQNGQNQNGQNGNNNNNDDDLDAPNDGGGNKSTQSKGGSTSALIIGVAIPIGAAGAGAWIYSNYFRKENLELGGSELSEIEDSDF